MHAFGEGKLEPGLLRSKSSLEVQERRCSLPVLQMPSKCFPRIPMCLQEHKLSNDLERALSFASVESLVLSLLQRPSDLGKQFELWLRWFNPFDPDLPVKSSYFFCILDV